MKVYIIAKIVDDNKKDTGYLLLDTDDNNKTMKVSKQQLINAMKANKIKIYNAKLVDNHIAGKYYSLNLLSYIQNNIVYSNNKYVVLINKLDKEFILCYLTLDRVIVKSVDYNDMIRMLNSNRLLNVGDNGELLCETENITSYTYKNSKRDLDKEVTDKNIVWTIEDFVAYMEMHGYKYNLNMSAYYGETYYDLSNVDIRCKSLKVPSRVKNIGSLYEGEITNIDSLIIAGDVKRILRLWDGRLSEESIVTIKDLVFQQERKLENEVTFNGCGLEYLIIPGELRSPYYRNLENSFNFCYFNRLEIQDITEKIAESFNNIKLNINSLVINTKTISESFSNIQNLTRVTLKEKIYSIYKSFNTTVLTVLDFSNAVELHSITDSFKELPNLFALDLSNCNNLISISSSFYVCEKLSSVKLNNNTKDIKYLFLYNTNVQELELPENIRLFSVTTGLKHIIYPEKVTDLTTDTTPSINKDTKLTFKGGLKKIDSKVVSNASISLESISELNTDLSHCIFERETFVDSRFTYFDSRPFKSLKTIPLQCFDKSVLIEYAILGDNIETVEAYSFRDCSRLKNVILGSNIKSIHPRAFSLTHSDYTVFYTVKGSYASKYMHKSNMNYVVIDVDSVDEAVDLVFNSAKTSEQKANKFLVLLHGTKYHALLKEHYIKNIEYTYKILSEIEDNMESDNKLVLNTSKFKEMPLSNIPFIETTVQHWMNETAKYHGKNELRDRFIATANLITSLSNNCDYLYKKEILNSAFIEKDTKYIYIDTNSAISCHTIVGAGNTKFSFICIIIKDKIVYMTPCMYSIIQKGIAECTLNFIFGAFGHTTPNFSVASELKTGDTVVYGSIVKINDAEFPREFDETIKDNINHTLKYIGTISSQAQFEVTKAESKSFNTLFYDIASGKFIEMQSKHTLTQVGIIMCIESIKGFLVKNTYTLDEINKINKKYFETFNEAFNNSKNIESIKLNLSSDKEIESMFKGDNFDIGEKRHFIDFADATYKYSIKQCEDMTLPIANEYMKLDFFEKSKVSLNDCIKKKLKSKLYELKNSDSLLIEYTIERNSYLIGIINENTPMSAKNILFHSCISAKTILESVYYIGYYRDKVDNKKCNYLDNNRVNTDEFMFINSLTTDFNVYDAGVKLNIAIDKVSGYTFLISEYWDTDFYKLFRFKKFSDAYNLFKRVQDENISCRNYLRDISDRLKSGTVESLNNTFNKVRNSILEGFPNNYPYPWAEANLFNELAKQPKDIM